MTYLYKLYLYDCSDDLGVLDHPAPNLEAGDEVTLDDGRRYRIVSMVTAPPGKPIHRLLSLEPVEDD